MDRNPNKSIGSAAAKAWSALEKVIVLQGNIAALLIIAIMFLTSADVILRYIVGRPIQGAYEISEIFYLAAVFLGLAYTQAGGEHVRVEILISRLSPHARLVIESAMLLLAVLIFGILGWQGAEDFVESLTMGEYRWGLIRIPLWPARLMIPIGAFALCLRLCGEVVLNLRGLFYRKEER